MLPTSSPELRRRSTTTTAASSPAPAPRMGGGNVPERTSNDPWSSHIVVDSRTNNPPRPSFSVVSKSQPFHDASPLASTMRFSSSWSSFIHRPRFQALLCLCLTVVPWIYHSSQTHRVHSVHRVLKRLLREHKTLLASLERSQLELERAQILAQEVELDNRELVEVLAAAAHGSYQDVAELQDATEEGELRVEGDGSVVRSGYGPTTSIYQDAQRMEDLYLQRIGIIEAALRNHSLQHIRQAYKPRTGGGGGGGGGERATEDGPLYVEIRLSVEGDDHDTHKKSNGAARAKDSLGHPSVLILETAPVNVAPHAIDHFLRLVDAKYYDGRTFALLHQPTLLSKAGSHGARSRSDSPYAHRIHTVEMQGRPGVADSHQERNAERMEDDSSRTLVSMAFTDHHRGLYPLQKYSVLFHGKPGGGPHFSIHMMDPQQQRHQQQGGDGSEDGWEWDDAADDDACFARVVRGQDVLDRMVERSRSTQSQQRVVVESVALVNSPSGTAAH